MAITKQELADMRLKFYEVFATQDYRERELFILAQLSKSRYPLSAHNLRLLIRYINAYSKYGNPVEHCIARAMRLCNNRHDKPVFNDELINWLW